VTRKVSVDSVGDTSADDLLHFLYDLTFRQHSAWGWVVACLFAAVPAWLSIVSIFESNIVGVIAFSLMACVIPGLRYYLLHRMGYSAFQKSGIPANDG